MDIASPDNFKCEYSTGSWLAVAAGIFYFLTAAVVLWIPPALKEEGEKDAIVSKVDNIDDDVRLTKNDTDEDQP